MFLMLMYPYISNESCLLYSSISVFSYFFVSTLLAYVRVLRTLRFSRIGGIQQEKEKNLDENNNSADICPAVMLMAQKIIITLL